MNVYMLYENREWDKPERYFDYENIIKDLELDIIFNTSSRSQEIKTGALHSFTDEDNYLGDTLKTVMMTPLRTEEEIKYRQEIIKDVVRFPDFIEDLYKYADETILKWNKLTGRTDGKAQRSNMESGLMTRAKLLELFVGQLEELAGMLDDVQYDFASDGIRNFIERFSRDYNDKIRQNFDKILNDISFYTETDYNVTGSNRSVRIILKSDIINGFKFDNLKLVDVETTGKKRKKFKRKKSASEIWLGAFFSGPAGSTKEDVILEDLTKLEYKIVDYIVSCCDAFVDDCRKFFEELHFETAFYMAALHLHQKLKRKGLPCCFPNVVGRAQFSSENLIELSMALWHNKPLVGNTIEANDKMLWIITGANQGGKSTFLRSVGIAQLMLQCGLFVSALEFSSGIFPNLYTHFTRREDCQMNSGRLDEELKRMRMLIDDMSQEDNLGDDVLVLLNESFATTTEKEGSIIAYDIIKALLERNVKVLTVTHLLSFAQKMHSENDARTEFFSAERKEDKTRTFKMIKTVPQLTSFGLDLYEQIVRIR